jgi:hypothetical protein
MTVLRELLADAGTRRLVATTLQRDRSTVYRWWMGLSFPARADAERLVALLAPQGLDFNGCYTTNGRDTDARG